MNPSANFPLASTEDARIRDLSERVGGLIQSEHRSLTIVRAKDFGLYLLLILCGLFSLLVTATIIFVPTTETLKFFTRGRSSSS